MTAENNKERPHQQPLFSTNPDEWKQVPKPPATPTNSTIKSQQEVQKHAADGLYKGKALDELFEGGKGRNWEN